MTQEQLIQLSKIYNTLLSVNTHGEDTFVMADCMRALLQVINEGSTSMQQGESEPVKEG